MKLSKQHLYTAGVLYFGTVGCTYLYCKSHKGQDVPSLTQGAKNCFDALADTYDNKIGSEERVLGYGLLRWWMLSQAKGDVLEISAGTGRNFKHYHYANIKALTVCDVSKPMLDVAETKYYDQLFINFKHPVHSATFCISDAHCLCCEHSMATVGRQQEAAEQPASASMTAQPSALSQWWQHLPKLPFAVHARQTDLGKHNEHDAGTTVPLHAAAQRGCSSSSSSSISCTTELPNRASNSSSSSRSGGSIVSSSTGSGTTASSSMAAGVFGVGLDPKQAACADPGNAPAAAAVAHLDPPGSSEMSPGLYRSIGGGSNNTSGSTTYVAASSERDTALDDAPSRPWVLGFPYSRLWRGASRGIEGTGDEARGASRSGASSRQETGPCSCCSCPRDVAAAWDTSEARCKRGKLLSGESLQHFAEGSFDTVVDTFGLCSHEDPVQVLRQARKVCRADGTIILLEHGRSTWDWLNQQLDSSAEQHHDKWGCWWNRDILRICQDAGLQIVSVTRWHFGTTYMIKACPAHSAEGQDGTQRSPAAVSH